MSQPRKKDSQRFRIYTSQRSGFEFGFQPITELPNAYWREAGKPVQDVNVQVSPNEFDQPPPSTQPLGGEGDISGDMPGVTNVYETTPNSTPIVYYVSASQSIPWNDNPVVYIGGSLNNVTMVSNPQIVAGRQSRVIAWQCVGSDIILNSANGLTFDFKNTPFIHMTSGGIITATYSETDSTWHVITFNPISGGF